MSWQCSRWNKITTGYRCSSKIYNYKDTKFKGHTKYPMAVSSFYRNQFSLSEAMSVFMNEPHYVVMWLSPKLNHTVHEGEKKKQPSKSSQKSQLNGLLFSFGNTQLPLRHSIIIFAIGIFANPVLFLSQGLAYKWQASSLPPSLQVLYCTLRQCPLLEQGHYLMSPLSGL